MKFAKTKINVCCYDPDPEHRYDPPHFREVSALVVTGSVWAATAALSAKDEPMEGLYAATHVPTGRALRQGMALPAAAVSELVRGLAEAIPRYGEDLQPGDSMTRALPGAARVLEAIREADRMQKEHNQAQRALRRASAGG